MNTISSTIVLFFIFTFLFKATVFGANCDKYSYDNKKVSDYLSAVVENISYVSSAGKIMFPDKKTTNTDFFLNFKSSNADLECAKMAIADFQNSEDVLIKTNAKSLIKATENMISTSLQFKTYIKEKLDGEHESIGAGTLAEKESEVISKFNDSWDEWLTQIAEATNTHVDSKAGSDASRLTKDEADDLLKKLKPLLTKKKEKDQTKYEFAATILKKSLSAKWSFEKAGK